MNEKISKIIKFFIVSLILIIIAVSGYIIGNQMKYQLDIRKADKVVENFQESLEEPYKNDTYGGKTPEETWAMFLDALKKGDIELASKYYAVGAGVAGRVPIDGIYSKQQDGQLNEWIKELKTLESDEQQSLSDDKRYYFYNYYNEKYKQTLSSPVVFDFNSHTKIWKISDL